MEILNSKKSVIDGVASYLFENVCPNHRCCMAEGRPMNEVLLPRILDGLPCPEISVFIELNHRTTDKGKLRMPIQESDFLFKPCRQGNIISIHPRTILCVGIVQASVQGIIQTLILFIPNQNDVVKPVCIQFCDIVCPVRRSVIAKYDLEVLEGLGIQRIQRLSQGGSAVIDSYQDGNTGHVKYRYSS